MFKISVELSLKRNITEFGQITKVILPQIHF